MGQGNVVTLAGSNVVLVRTGAAHRVAVNRAAGPYGLADSLPQAPEWGPGEGVGGERTESGASALGGWPDRSIPGL